MPLALILSSFVAATRIGGGAQQYVLAADGIEPVLAPTALLGRSPARGAPGGGPVAADLFASMLDGVEAEGVFARADLVITGHFSLPDQVHAAADAIVRLRSARGGAPTIVVVDPILGDEPKGLYVKPEVADVVAGRLVPMADWITPNAWEMSHLTGVSIADPAGAVEAARRLGRPALITSVPAGEGRIGVVLASADGATLFSHAKAAAAPNGTGDLVTASFSAGLTLGLGPLAAADRAVRAVVAALAASAETGASQLPLIATRTGGGDVRVEDLAGRGRP